MVASVDKESKMISELKELRNSPNLFIVHAICIVLFFLVHFFYFKTEMLSNYLGLLFVFALSIVRDGYSKSVKANKRIDSMIEEINQNCLKET